MADQGDVNLCKFVIEKTGHCVNETLPALIIASEKGHTEVCNLFIESGILHEMELQCAFHSAARSGHLEVCQLISDNLADKNPADLENGETPLHHAAKFGHLDVCRYIVGNVENKNPQNNFEGFNNIIRSVSKVSGVFHFHKKKEILI